MTDHFIEDKQDLSKKHGRNIILVIVFILLLEGLILISAFSQSGNKKCLQIIDSTDQVIYEINGEHLSEFDKYYFENTFGSLEKYKKKLTTKNIPFPFRAWLTAAAGLPLFLILISAFAVKAYKSLFDATEPGIMESYDEISGSNGLPAYMKIFERLDIFAIGFILLLSVFLYWVIPNLFTYISKATIDFIINYKWFFIIISAFGAGTMLWIIYLRYLLARKTIEVQKEITIKQIEFNAIEKRRLIDHEDVKRIESMDESAVFEIKD